MPYANLYTLSTTAIKCVQFGLYCYSLYLPEEITANESTSSRVKWNRCGLALCILSNCAHNPSRSMLSNFAKSNAANPTGIIRLLPVLSTRTPLLLLLPHHTATRGRSLLFLCLCALLEHLWEQNRVTVVQAVNSIPQSWQIRCTSIFELITYH
jgi:hypothetical protein